MGDIGDVASRRIVADDDAVEAYPVVAAGAACADGEAVAVGVAGRQCQLSAELLEGFVAGVFNRAELNETGSSVGVGEVAEIKIYVVVVARRHNDVDPLAGQAVAVG